MEDTANLLGGQQIVPGQALPPVNGNAGSFDAYVKQQTENSPYLHTLPIGEYRMKFIGAEMVSVTFNGETSISPKYHFIHNGVEKELTSKNKRLYALKDRVGMDVIIVKSTKGGKNDWSLR
jgi:hypothetical protein